MRVVALDFETFFSDEYSLKRMTTESYIRDKRFEAHGAAIKWGPDHAARWYDAHQLRQVLADEDWSQTAILAHHAQFDGFILAHHFGVKPRLWLDTLSMARMCFGNHLSVSLDSVRTHFKMAAKSTPYAGFKGRHWQNIDEDLRRLIADGCCDEVESIWTIFHRLATVFPRAEYEVIDLTIRMFTEPVLCADVDLLAQLWEQEERNKNGLMANLGVTAGDLNSAKRFTDLLAACGIEVATKKGKNGPIPALAKTDEFMRELLEDDNPRVGRLARARLGIKTTIIQTRAETLGFMAQRGTLAVYLRYCGAHTTRWSGGDDSNFQNFKRGSELRKCILAPEGSYLATVDLCQIECRILNFLAGQTDVIDRFRAGSDPYVGIASQFYGRSITKADAAERGTGKQAELSCGYGCGWRRFQQVAKLGSYGPPVALTDAEAQRAVNLYRDTHKAVVELWRFADDVMVWFEQRRTLPLKCMTVKDGNLYLPNGAWINYHTLKREQDETGEAWWMQTRHGRTKMYGAKLVENFVQALARVVMSEAGVRIARAGFRPVLSSHDEWSFLVPRNGHSSEALEFILEEMKREPKWLPGLPIDCEGSLSERYDK